ncbi:unnamed protein product [Symbiodinium natans]|uniref:Uncharacterized protein n=1 Tax=Symbiodinium natans TaxID=878477 RepID=A0A812UPE6_9DINO|nr:unnamed protein product [Symbiodinium natans]
MGPLDSASSENIGQLLPLMPSSQPAPSAEDDGMPSCDGMRSSFTDPCSPSVEPNFPISTDSAPGVWEVEADWYRHDSKSPRLSMGNCSWPDESSPPLPPNGLMHQAYERRLEHFLKNVQAHPGKLRKLISGRREKAGMVDEDMMSSTGWFNRAKTVVQGFVRQIS